MLYDRIGCTIDLQVFEYVICNKDWNKVVGYSYDIQ